jgi:hypothetical protein
MTTSSSYNFTSNRDAIITQSMRIVNQIGEGETPTTTQTTEVSIALNTIVKEFQAQGMQLWTIVQYSTTLVSGTSAYTVGISSTIASVAPLKVIQAWTRTNSLDTPVNIITASDYRLLSNKTSTGRPNQLWYTPPGNLSSGEMQGTVTLFPAPGSYEATNTTLYFVGQRPIQDLDSSTDNVDFPSYFENALVWALADRLAYYNGLPLAERSMISRKAEEYKDTALSFGTEEGSIYFQPNWGYHR